MPHRTPIGATIAIQHRLRSLRSRASSASITISPSLPKEPISRKLFYKMTHPCSSKRDFAVDVSGEEHLIDQHEDTSMPQGDGCSSSKAADDDEDRPIQVAEAGSAPVSDPKTAMPSFLKISHDGLLFSHNHL